MTNSKEILGNTLPRVAIIVIENSAGKFFVNLRLADKKIFPSLYGLGAGGKIEEGETPEEGARRELQEETGITGEIKFLFELYFEDHDYHHQPCRHQLHVYYCKFDGEIVCDGTEWQSSRWVSKEELDLLSDEEKLCPDTKVIWLKIRS
jgi:mutator protein MutT